MPTLIHVTPKKRRVAFVPHGFVRRKHETSPLRAAIEKPTGQTADTDVNFICTSTVKHSIRPPKSAVKHAVQRHTQMAVETPALPPIPDLFTKWPSIRDELETESSEIQDETVRECLPFLNDSVAPLSDYGDQGLPSPAREKHIRFLHRCLGTLPAAFVGQDAARPWIVYWVLTALSLLGEDIVHYRERVIQTLSPMQNAGGGFGGGHGQLSHVAPSYAAVLSLAMVGGPESLDTIDRRSLWRWLGQVKQKDGGFRVCVDGEEDVRGGYCSMVMIALLKLPLTLPPDAPARQAGLETFIDGLPEYPDAYHSCYVLAGLSSAQHHSSYTRGPDYDPSLSLNDAFHWVSSPRSFDFLSQTGLRVPVKEERLTAIHPIFVISWPAVEATASWYENKESF
ncbi:MAG: hypothetical protein Q9181_004863 [Wetmoreana brouardii]